MNANEEENTSLSQSFHNLNNDNGFVFDEDHYDPNATSNETVRNEVTEFKIHYHLETSKENPCIIVAYIIVKLQSQIKAY
jgi:hypothetical protein